MLVVLSLVLRLPPLKSVSWWISSTVKLSFQSSLATRRVLTLLNPSSLPVVLVKVWSRPLSVPLTLVTSLVVLSMWPKMSLPSISQMMTQVSKSSSPKPNTLVSNLLNVLLVVTLPKLFQVMSKLTNLSLVKLLNKSLKMPISNP